MNGLVPTGFIRGNVHGRLCCGMHTAIRGKIGSARINVSLQCCRVDGHTITAVIFGNAPDEPHSTTMHQKRHSVSRKKPLEINLQGSQSIFKPKIPETIYRSDPQVDGPFYSLGMKCYRIQYYQRGQTYHICRESSLHIERLADSQIIEGMLAQQKPHSWESWLEFIERVRNLPPTTWKGTVFVYGIDATRTVIHG